MAVEKMRLVSIFGEYEQLNACIQTLLKFGCFEPERAYEATMNQSGYMPISEPNPYTQRLKKITDVLNYCNINCEDIAIDNRQEVENAAVDSMLDELSNALHQLQTEREQTQKQIEQCNAEIAALSHFKDLNIDLGQTDNGDFVRVKFGHMPTEGFIKLNEYADNPYFIFHVCSFDKNTYWGVYVTPVDYEEQTDRIFASLFFEQVFLPEEVKNPALAIQEKDGQKQALLKQLKEIEQKIDGYYETEGQNFKALYAQIKRQYEGFDYRQYAVRYHKKFACMLGWVPESNIAKLEDMFQPLSGFTVTEINPSSDLHAGTLHLVPPTKMKNGRLFRAYEFYVQIFGVPNYKEIDPTIFVAITYTLLYGIMFADVGQGIVLAIAALFMWKKLKMPLGKVIFPCGLCGTFFGLIFGSVFGNEELLNPLYKKLGFAEKPIEVMNSATELLAFSIGIGVALLLLAMILGIYSNFKKGKLGAALFSANGIAGFVFYASVILLVGNMLLSWHLPTAVIVTAGIILPLILMFLQTPLANLLAGDGFRVENVGDYVLESIFELFEIILSFFTNTVSFLRVGAFVLIHAGMMMAFTSLAQIVGGGIGGTIMLVFGNAFVIVLEGLLVGIQVLRLEFYEMFSRFYDGDGREFKPMSYHRSQNR